MTRLPDASGAPFGVARELPRPKVGAGKPSVEEGGAVDVCRSRVRAPPAGLATQGDVEEPYLTVEVTLEPPW